MSGLRSAISRSRFTSAPSEPTRAAFCAFMSAVAWGPVTPPSFPAAPIFSMKKLMTDALSSTYAKLALTNASTIPRAEKPFDVSLSAVSAASASAALPTRFPARTAPSVSAIFTMTFAASSGPMRSKSATKAFRTLMSGVTHSLNAVSVRCALKPFSV